MTTADHSGGLSIDETQDVFADGYGIKKANAMLKEKHVYAAQLHEAQV